MKKLTSQEEGRILYAFGHAVSGYDTDAHSGDSAELASDVLQELMLSKQEIEIVQLLAMEVHGNYQYTGEAKEYTRKIENGEV